MTTTLYNYCDPLSTHSRLNSITSATNNVQLEENSHIFTYPSAHTWELNPTELIVAWFNLYEWLQAGCVISSLTSGKVEPILSSDCIAGGVHLRQWGERWWQIKELSLDNVIAPASVHSWPAGIYLACRHAVNRDLWVLLHKNIYIYYTVIIGRGLYVTWSLKT